MTEDFLRQNFRITPNAQLVPVQICGSSTFGRYNKIASGLTYNMFISDGWLINFAGYKKLIELNATGKSVRGMFKCVRGDFVLAVVGTTVYRIDNSYSFYQISGPLDTSDGEVFMDENLNGQICIVDGLSMYIYNYETLSAVTKQTGGPLGSVLVPNYVSFHNTFFLIGNGITNGNGARWFAYAYSGPVAITSQSDFAISTKPDTALAIRRLPGQANNVLVFGRTVCEIWTAIGGLQNYRRNSSVNIDYGCASVSTIASSDQYTAWLGINESNQPVIMVFSGEGAQRISTDGIDYLLGGIQEPAKSTAMFYRQDGHLFYQLTFYGNNDKITLVYDFNTQKFFNLCDYNSDIHPARDMIYFNNKMLFCSLKNACIYETSTDITVYNENLAPGRAKWAREMVHAIPRTRICEGIRRPDSGRFIANSFVMTMAQGDDPGLTGLDLEGTLENIMVTEGDQIEMITNYGEFMITENSELEIGLNSIPLNLIYRPRIDMSISKDSGTTWSNYVSRNLNALGNRENIITWNNLGRSNDLTLKFRFWMTSNIIVTDGFLEVY